jgi:hypothetical protein
MRQKARAILFVIVFTSVMEVKRAVIGKIQGGQNRHRSTALLFFKPFLERSVRQ